MTNRHLGRGHQEPLRIHGACVWGEDCWDCERRAVHLAMGTLELWSLWAVQESIGGRARHLAIGSTGFERQ